MLGNVTGLAVSSSSSSLLGVSIYDGINISLIDLLDVKILFYIHFARLYLVRLLDIKGITLMKLLKQGCFHC